MSCNCKLWTDCGVTGGGCCAAGHFGGRPSLGTCARCESRDRITPMDPPAPAPPLLTTLTRGGAGVAKAILGIDRATDITIAARRAACLACPQREEILGGIVTRCAVCKCALPIKVLIAGEKCPIGTW